LLDRPKSTVGCSANGRRRRIIHKGDELLLLLVNVKDILGIVYFGIHFNRKCNWALVCYRPEDGTTFLLT